MSHLKSSFVTVVSDGYLFKGVRTKNAYAWVELSPVFTKHHDLKIKPVDVLEELKTYAELPVKSVRMSHKQIRLLTKQFLPGVRLSEEETSKYVKTLAGATSSEIKTLITALKKNSNRSK